MVLIENRGDCKKNQGSLIFVGISHKSKTIKKAINVGHAHTPPIGLCKLFSNAFFFITENELSNF